MAGYTIYYSDPAKSSAPIIIPDGTQDVQSTSLTLIGRNYPGYGQAIATDLVHLLENFASAAPPSNPIEGQLWFDTSDPNNKKLRINDGGINGVKWAPINGVFQQPDQPTNVKLGDIWVDTARQQLNFYNGSSFTLVGPNYSSATKTGSYPITLTDLNGNSHNVIVNYVNDNAIEIISSEGFVPNPRIAGFSAINTGVNVSSDNLGTVSNPSYPKINGITDSASALQITIPNSQRIPADAFLRNDIDQHMNGSLSIINENGLKIGLSPTFILQRKNQYNASLVNTYNNGQFTFQIADNFGNLKSLMVMDGSTRTVTINDPAVVSSTAGLNLYGSLFVSNTATINNTVYITGSQSNISDVSGNALQVTGGVGIGATLVVTGEHILRGPLTVGPLPITTPQNTLTSIIVPTLDTVYDLGDPAVRWRNVYGKVFQAGPLDTAHFVGIASSATYMSSPSAFSVTGDLSGTPQNFYGGGIPVTLPVTANGTIISSKPAITVTTGTDALLMYSSSSTQLYQQAKRDFLRDINYQDQNVINPVGYTTPAGSLVPIGSIMPYGGTITSRLDAPLGWLPCDGSDLGTNPLYQNLRSVIGRKYDVAGTNYLLPNLNNKLLSGTVPITYIIKY